MSEKWFLADYPALRRPRLKAGVGMRTATLIWAMTAMVWVLLGVPWGFAALPVGAFIHAVLAWAFKKDDQIMALYVVHEVVPNNLYSGLPSHGEKMLSRPRGFARDLPLQQ